MQPHRLDDSSAKSKDRCANLLHLPWPCSCVDEGRHGEVFLRLPSTVRAWAGLGSGTGPTLEENVTEGPKFVPCAIRCWEDAGSNQSPLQPPLATFEIRPDPQRPMPHAVRAVAALDA